MGNSSKQTAKDMSHDTETSTWQIAMTEPKDEYGPLPVTPDETTPMRHPRQIDHEQVSKQATEPATPSSHPSAHQSTQRAGGLV